MTVLRAWAPLFWSGVLVGLVHTIVDALGADPPAAIVYGSGVLLAASAVPVLIGLARARRRPARRRRGSDGRSAARAGRPPGRRRVRGAVAVLIEPERRTEELGNVRDRSFARPGYAVRDRIGDQDLHGNSARRDGRPRRGRPRRSRRRVRPRRARHARARRSRSSTSPPIPGMPRLPRDLIPRAILQSPDPYRSFDDRRLEAAARRTRPRSGLGETARYSNFGVALLGHALARAAGRSYDLIAERILQPLDLRETAVATLDESDPRAARGHDPFAFRCRRGIWRRSPPLAASSPPPRTWRAGWKLRCDPTRPRSPTRSG